MTRSALLAAVALATALLPAVAEARDDRRGGYYGGHGGYYGGHGGHGGHYDRGHDRHRRHDNDGDELAAGVIGLAIGTVLGAAIANSNEPRYAPPPPRYYTPPPAYYNPPPAYYAPPPVYTPPPRYYANAPTCVLRERVWDPYAGQYVRVERRIPC
jgi:hypothetical protein